MHTFHSLDSAWNRVLLDLLQAGEDLASRDGSCIELEGYVFRITDPRRSVLSNPLRKLSPAYGAAELLWYLAGEKDITRLLKYAPSYTRFAQPGTLIAHGAYGARWYEDLSFSAQAWDMTEGGQLELAIELLKKDPNTRQCILTMWNAGDLPCAMSGRYKDIPCTLSLQFLLRNGQLNCITTMRSNDAWLGLPYDVFAFTSIQRIIATELNCKLGWYQHQAGSMHLYVRDFQKATDCASSTIEDSPIFAVRGSTLEAMKIASVFERDFTLKEDAYTEDHVASVIGTDTLAAKCVQLCKEHSR